MTASSVNLRSKIIYNVLILPILNAISTQVHTEVEISLLVLIQLLKPGWGQAAGYQPRPQAGG